MVLLCALQGGMLDRAPVPSFLTSLSRMTLTSSSCLPVLCSGIAGVCDHGRWCPSPVDRTHSVSTNCGQEDVGIAGGHCLTHRSVAKKQVPAGPEMRMSLSLRVHFPKLGLMLDGMS